MSEIPFAATVMALRNFEDGLQVLMVQRSSRSAFMPKMWVFPGGRVESTDEAHVEGEVRGEVPCFSSTLTPAFLRPFAVAAIRETYEEAGVWLGAAPHPRFDVSGLHPWARWVTPEGEKRRYDTLFFVARAQSLPTPHADDSEVFHAGWFAPSEILRGAGARTMPLAPPTWWAIHELSRFATVDDVLEASKARDLRAVCPVRDDTAEGFAVALPGDPKHADAARNGLPHRIYWEGEGWHVVLRP